MPKIECCGCGQEINPNDSGNQECEYCRGALHFNCADSWDGDTVCKLCKMELRGEN